MLYTQKIEGALSALSLSPKDLENTLQLKSDAISQFVDDIQSAQKPAYSLVKESHLLLPLVALAENWQSRFKNLVVIGVGGSSLGSQMLSAILGFHASKKMNLFFVDNVDPTSLDDLIGGLDLSETVILSISKSGGTIETLVQTTLFMQACEAEDICIADHFFCIVSEGESPLRTLMSKHNVGMMNHPAEVGGRFSVTSLVGLLPAAAAGVDIEAFRQGAERVLLDFERAPLVHPAALGAALSVESFRQGYNIQPLMPYSDRLRLFAPWFVQLHAESLGKEGQGSTPMAVLGSTDQHSALQLFMEGPKDKLISLIITNMRGQGTTLDSTHVDGLGKDYLAGMSCGTLLYNQAHGTKDALIGAGVPVRTLELEVLDERSLGALTMHFMLETAVAACLLGVNPWNQPGVEDAKVRTVEYLQADYAAAQ